MSGKQFNPSGTGDTDNEGDHRPRIIDILTLPDLEQQLLTWMIRQREVSLAEAIAYMNQEEEVVSTMFNSLLKQGLVQKLNREGGLRYRSYVAPKQSIKGSENLWQELDS